MKVIHGMSEVAGQGIYSVQGLQANGVDANMAVWVKNHNNYPVDIHLGINKSDKWQWPVAGIKMAVFAVKSLIKYDIMHSHFGYSLLPLNIDVFFHKLFKLDIFSEFHGSDIRFMFNDVKYDCFMKPEISDKVIRKNQKRIRRLLGYSKGVILHDAELIPHLPALNIPVYIVPLRVDLGRFEPIYPNAENKKPIIVHAPSRRSGKGTEQILKTLESLNCDYELILVEGKTQEEAIELYKKADIIIDQISVGTYGVFAIEAMALGKPVITYISDEMRETLPDELPIVSADFETLPEVLDALISDGKKRYELGMAGRQYAERFHDNKRVASYLAKIYDGTIEDTDLFKLL